MAKRRKWESETARSVCAETGLSDPVEGAITLAEKLTQECKLTHPAAHLNRLASWQGAKIEELEMDDAGRIIPIFQDDFDYLIQVNVTHPQSRKNFSICHEIGHSLMPNFFSAPAPRTDKETMRWDEKAEEEFLCDVAAAEMLMPRREFVPRLRGCEMRIEAIAQLADEFGASLEATAINIVRAQIDDLAVIVWELGLRKQQKMDSKTLSLWDEEEGFGAVPPSYRIKLASACGQLQNHHFPHNKSISEDSIVYQAADTTLSICGEQILPIGGENSQKFFVQAQSFPMWRNGSLERRVFMMVHLKPPQWD